MFTLYYTNTTTMGGDDISSGQKGWNCHNGINFWKLYGPFKKAKEDFKLEGASVYFWTNLSYFSLHCRFSEHTFGISEDLNEPLNSIRVVGLKPVWIFGHFFGDCLLQIASFWSWAYLAPKLGCFAPKLDQFSSDVAKSKLNSDQIHGKSPVSEVGLILPQNQAIFAWKLGQKRPWS